jgi:hypothetical protein
VNAHPAAHQNLTERGVGRVPLLFAASASFLLAGCATVFSRGVVRDANGTPLGNVSIRITSTQTGALVTSGFTDAGGCFSMFKTAPRGEKRFLLDASASGFKPTTFALDLQTPILLGTLAAVSSEKASGFRKLRSEEAYTEWEMTCVPPSPTGN